jgi:hypothetical protein
MADYLTNFSVVLKPHPSHVIGRGMCQQCEGIGGGHTLLTTDFPERIARPLWLAQFARH